MSWLDTGISQIAGQISNFTKEVLTEGTEEVDDHATELRLARTRLGEIETQNTQQRFELERLNKENHDWVDKLESAELQIKAISAEYRAKLEESQNEVKALKQKQHEILENQSKMVLGAPATLPHSASMPSLDSESFASDEHDFDDVISSQHEINRLRSSLQRLDAECRHWKQIATSQANGTSSLLETPTSESAAQEKIKTLEEELSNAIDSLQRERAALQDVHRQKVAALKQGHQEEVQLLKQEILELQHQGQQGTSWSEALREEVARLKHELQTVNAEKKQMTIKMEELEMGMGRLSPVLSPASMTSSTPMVMRMQSEESDLESPSASLILDLSEAAVQKKHLENTISMLQSQVETLEGEQQSFEEARADWESEKVALETVVIDLRRKLRQKESSSPAVTPTKELSPDVGERSVEGAETPAESDSHPAAASNTVSSQLFDLQQQLSDMTSAHDGAKQELTQLREQLLNKNNELQHCEEKLKSAEERLHEKSSQLQASEQAQKLSQLSLQTLKQKCETAEQKLLASEQRVIELSSQQEHQSQLTEVSESVTMGLTERDATILQLREQIAALQSDVAGPERESQLRDQILEMRDRIAAQDEEISQLKDELMIEKEALEANLEELNEQHEAAQSQIMKKCADLQGANDELREQITNLQQEAAGGAQHEAFESGAISQAPGMIPTTVPDIISEPFETAGSQLEVLRQRCEQLEKERSKAEAELNTMYVQHGTLSNELSQRQQERDSSQKQIANKDAEIDDMKLKAKKAAMSLNDLHMDKQELEVHICSLKGEVKTLQQQLKKASADSTEYKQNLSQVQSELDRKHQELSLHLSSDSTSSLQKHIEELEAELSEKRKEIESERQGMKNLQINFDNVEGQVKVLVKTNDELTSQMDQLSSKLSEKNSEISTLVERKNAAETELENTRREKDGFDLKLEEAREERDQVGQVVRERDESITNLQAALYSSQQTVQQQEANIQQLQIEIGQIRAADAEVKLCKDENTQLKLDLERLQSQLNAAETSAKPVSKPSSFDLVHTLEAEVTNLNTKLEGQAVRITEYEQQVKNLEMLLSDKDEEIQTLVAENEGQHTRLNESQVVLSQENQALHALQTSIVEKDKQIESLREKLDNVKLSSDSMLEKSTSILSNGTLKQIEDQNDVNEDKDGPDNEKNDLVTEVEQLKSIVTQKDGVITELRTGNSALMKLLEERSLAVHGDRTLVEYHKLDNEVRSMQREREQIMSVLNEKSRECSNLKSEVHKLMNVVSQQKKALSKLQEDNTELMKKPDVPNQDMTKEAVRNLSRIIRDKDLEIESLGLKNATLLQVLQDTSPSGQHMSTLMTERDNLAQQVAMYQKDRETIVAALQAKHEESVSFHGQLQRVTHLRSLESQQLENLQSELMSLRKQYEDKQQALVKANNDMVNYKQKHAEVEMKCKELRFRQVGSEPSTPTDVKDSEESQILIAALKETIVKKEEALHEAEKGWQNEKGLLETEITNHQRKIKEFEKSIQDQLGSMRDLRGQMQSAQDVTRSKEQEVAGWRKQNENLSFQLSGAQGEVVDLQKERDKLAGQREQLTAELEQLRMANSRITASLGERDLMVSGLEERVATMTQLVAEKAGIAQTTEQRLVQSEAVHRQAQACQVERDQAWSALQMKQTECQQLTLQVEELTERERKLAREVDRLRTHLLQIEEGYTQEAIAAEEREKELRNRLAIAEDSAAQTSSAVHSASLAASREVESLQEQLLSVTEQRDQITVELASAQETANQYATSLANLQMVLEQFTHEKEHQQALEIERCRQMAKEAIAQRDEFAQNLSSTQVQLEDANEALEAAHRLSEQLDKREEVILALKDEVQLRENELQRVQEELAKVTSSSQAKVDKELVKNLFIGYFHSPASKRMEVIKLIGKVLHFTSDELQEIGAEENPGWLGGLFRKASTAASPPNSPSQTSLNKSLSELFITFLERESTPSPIVRLPAEQMAREQQQQQQERRNQTHFNPFSVPAHVTPPIGKQGEGAAAGAGSQHHILMNPAGGHLNPMTAATLPLFTPVAPTNNPAVGRPEPANRATNITPVLVGASSSGRVSASSSGRSTPASSSAILQGVLQQ